MREGEEDEEDEREEAPHAGRQRGHSVQYSTVQYCIVSTVQYSTSVYSVLLRASYNQTVQPTTYITPFTVATVLSTVKMLIKGEEIRKYSSSRLSRSLLGFGFRRRPPA